MGEQDRDGIDELVRSHAEGDITIRQIATITDLTPEEAYDLVESRYENTELGADETIPVTCTPDDFTTEALAEAFQEDVSAATETDDAEKIRIAEQWRRGEISEDEARQQLGDDTISGMIEDREAFREAMQRDTSDFLQSE